MTKYVSISVEKHFINIMRTMGTINTEEQHDRGLKRSNEPSDMKPFFSPPGPGGGHFRNFWVGMCRWDPGTLNLYQS